MVSDEPRRLFAIVPAAGQSRRMGCPKLLLRLGEETVMGRLLRILTRADIADVVVVVRRDDDDLREEVLAHGATVASPQTAPPFMRDSVAHAVGKIRGWHTPNAQDGWLLVPADHPTLKPNVLDQLIQYWNQNDCRVLIPTYQGRRGHPTLFRWTLADEVPHIPSDCGLNWLLDAHAQHITELPVDDESIVCDLDRPLDYAVLAATWRDDESR